MGIDIYARFDGQTEEEREAQYTGFSIKHGHVGYLREAYHGPPYATKFFVSEAFRPNAPEEGVPIKASVLRHRLMRTLALTREREETVYKNFNVSDDDPVLQSFRDFVAYCEAAEKRTGKPCRIYASY